MSTHYHLALSRTAPELTVVNNEVALGGKKFKDTAAIVEWCREATDDAARSLRLKAVRDLVLRQQEILEDFAAEFMQHIQHDPQFSTVVRHEPEWQDFTTIALNAQQRQERLEGSIRTMKRYWNYEKVDALMSSTRSRHVGDETAKLAKRYPNEYEKAVGLVQQAVLQRRKQIARGVRATAEYTVSDFKNAASNDYKDRTTPTSSELRDVGLKRKGERLIEDVSEIAPSGGGYVSSPSIRSTPLPGRGTTASPREPLMDAPSTPTPPSRTARSIPSRSVQSAVRFPNLPPQPASKTTEEQAEEALHEELGSPLAEEEILPSRKAAADDRPRVVEETPQPEQPPKAPSPPSSPLPSAAIGLHADARKEVKRAFDAAVKFVPGGPGRNASTCTCEKVDPMVLWKLGEGEYKTNELLTILKEFKQVQEDEEEGNVCRPHWRLLAWKLGLVLVDERGAELPRARLLARLYQCSDHDREFGDLKADASTGIWFRPECRPARASDPSRALKFRQTATYMVPSGLRWDLVANELFGAKGLKKWNEDGVVIVPNMFEWLVQAEVFEDLLTELDMLDHHYSGPSVGFVGNAIYSFLQAVVSQDVELYLRYVTLRKDHRLRAMVLPGPLRHRWNGVAPRKRYLHGSLPDLAHNRHEDRLLTMVSFSKQDATNCTEFCEGLPRSFSEWAKRLMQRGQTIGDVPLQVTSDNLTKEDLLEFGADWVSEPMKKGDVCFASPKVPRRVIGGTLDMKTIVYVAYRCLQNDGETLEEPEAGTRDDISKLYRDLAPPSYLPVEFSAELSSSGRRFPAAMEAPTFSAIGDAIVGRRVWDSPAVRMELDQLFSRNTSRPFIEKVRANTLEAMSGFLDAVKQAERWCFGTKSF